MNKLELILYKVGHGLALSLIEYPEKYVTQIDLGSEGDFSPLEYLSESRGLRPDILFITHPHADHLSDIGQAGTYYPDSIQFIDYDWDDVINRERSDSKWVIREFTKLARFTKRRDYYGNASLRYWYWNPEKAKELFGDSSYVNNSSLFIVYTWQAFKICICGDLETKALENMISAKEPNEEALETDILVAAHHGHSQGYTSEWPEVIGKPYVSLISVQNRDPSIASGYSSSDFARGVTFGGETRYALTTRRDGTIVVTMWYENGKPTWVFKKE